MVLVAVPEQELPAYNLVVIALLLSAVYITLVELLPVVLVMHEFNSYKSTMVGVPLHCVSVVAYIADLTR